MRRDSPKRPLRVALACPGVGLVQRGFERLFYDLFKVLEGELDVTLFKGGGEPGEREKILTFLPRNGRFLKALPVHHLIGRTPIHVECLTFALAMVPHLRAGRFDVVQCVDPPLARILYKLRRLLGLEFRLLYTHACTMPPRHYPPADHMQQVSEEPWKEALADGISAAAMSLVPLGIHPDNFVASRSKDELRREHGVAPGTFVILQVAALNRAHKRTHYLIDEVAKLEGDYLLWLDGSMDQGEPDLIDYARLRLGERCRITQVASGKVGDLYRIADVMTHCASWEAFGLSIAEGAVAGLPVLVHDAPHFRWLMPNPHAWVDMLSAGALSARLSHLMEHPESRAEVRCGDQARRRFDWRTLGPEYAAMLDRVGALVTEGRDGSAKNYFWQLHGQ